jgi:hypothetical protein
MRLSGVRLEELLEITHLALVSYRLPDSGEIVPLLQIVPSKSNEERLLQVDPELASVLATIITRLRAGNDGTVPLVARYDHHEPTTGPLLPHLFQRALGARREVISPGTVYNLINTALAAAGLKDATGQSLAYRPHDFRRCFTTEAVTGGLPVHITARILGHKSLTTTETYRNSQELHQTGEEAAGQQLARLPGRRSGRPDASILTWEDLAVIPSDARFAHQGACIRREGQKRSDEGTRGFVAEVRVPGAVSGGFQYRTPPEAVFQDDLIRSYRAFLGKRRATRPAGEYCEPTDVIFSSNKFSLPFQQVRTVAYASVTAA